MGDAGRKAVLFERELPADAEIIAYCRGPYCVFAHDAVRLLGRYGYRAIRLTDGITESRLAGLPVATASPMESR